MNRVKPFVFGVLMPVILLAVAACGGTPTGTSVADLPTAAGSPMPTATPTLIPSTTFTPTPIATDTPSPTATPTATSIPSATPTSTPTTTPTPVPTLDGFEGVPIPEPEALERTIRSYADAMTLAPGAVQVTFREVTDVRGEPFVAAITDDGTPLFVAFQEPDTGQWAWQPATLKNLARAVDPNLEISVNFTGEKDLWRDPVYLGILNRDFNTIVLTAGIAWRWFEPEPGSYNKWMLSDVENQLRIFESLEDTTVFRRVQALVFAAQQPEWLKPAEYSREQAVEFLTKHIEKVVSLFKGTTAHQWVVINEPYFKTTKAESGFDYVRADALYEIISPDYIEIAFAAARQADPSGHLIYNDTANHSLVKSDPTNALYTELTTTHVNRLKAKGLIDGVGLQMHLDAAKPPTEQELIRAMQSYDVPVYITELDVDLSNLTRSQQERLNAQADLYATVLRAALQSGVCKSFGVYDLGDKYSWLVLYQNKPMSQPTLFDDALNPKPAYYALLRVFLEQLAGH